MRPFSLTDKYLTTLRELQFADQKITITLPTSQEEVIEKASGEFPFWAHLWPSANALADALTKEKQICEGKSVLDLGCGLGLTGIMAAKLNANSVTFLDYDLEAIEFANHNCETNLAPSSNLFFLNIDFRKLPKNKKYDIILVADLLYDEELCKELPQFLTDHLNGGGVALISEPKRKIATPFFESMKTQKFTISEHNQFTYTEANITLYTKDFL